MTQVVACYIDSRMGNVDACTRLHALRDRDSNSCGAEATRDFIQETPMNHLQLQLQPSSLSELPKYNVIKYQSPASVATAIDDMADAIVTKATQKAKEAIENAACDNSQTKQQSALE